MADLTGLEEAVRARGTELTTTASTTVLEETRQAAPVLTGATRDSIHIDPFDEPTVVGFDITADTPQAGFTDKGTNGLYVIQAKNAKVLAFVGRGGEMVFRRFVTHPGIKAQNWFALPMGDRFRTALEQAQ